ncbi:Major facilitator superfamily domain, general substrate transporter [Penicillium expansum]|uniref:Major facilitator superfamily domain, general substrate transporter n=1 Tax=Penicillium expansum TaxID=27334 RepID=A0A0A2KE37_PENEN|nr:Major facilitator superfamily domain, general substrate transporter [Penicillium expansum]KGO54610.1 Major facilitator superfamily domain, general substrate transporter [Penicillium expansum]KGO62620.1 Major facilitator superfamily domain, general substrate transporter [Penicillium expansum]
MDTKSIKEAHTADIYEPGMGVGSAEIYIDPVKERRMMRKFDIFAIGMLGAFYMMANLDRSNIGNANTAGLQEDLGLVGNQFGTATTLLYATYVPFEGPIAVLLKIIGPKPLLSTCAFCWGITTLGMAFIQNWQGLYACRLMTGLFEAGLIPCINVYIALVYKKSERGKRSALIFAFSAFSSAFGGLLAYGLTQVHGPNGWEGWRWLFAIEGAMTLLLVPIFFFVFPKHPTTAWFLSAEEKSMIQARYDNDPHWGQDEEFSWAESLSALTDPKWYAFWIYQFSVDVSLYGFTTFLPKIVSGLGYSGVRANLMTVPIYMVGLVWFLMIAYCSDRANVRGPFLAGPLLCLIMGYSLLISVENLNVRFFACFVVALGIYPTTGLSLMWLQDNTARHFKRATMVGMTLCFGNTAGVAVGQIFTTESAPRYIKGLSISLGLAVVALLPTMSLTEDQMLGDSALSIMLHVAKSRSVRVSYTRPKDIGVRDLEGEVKALRAQKQRSRASSELDETSCLTQDPVQPSAQSPDIDVSNPLLESPTGFVAARSSSQPIFIGEASCVAFGDTLLQCVDKDADLSSWASPTYFQHDIFHRLMRPEVVLPDRIQARLLVEVAIRFIGTDYHLILKKTFFDTLDRTCAGEIPRNPAWMCKFFVLLALGEMYSNRKRRMADQHVPGTDYFLRAVGLLQDLYETPSVEQVEVMVLFCFYSNALGRVKTAYTYSGIALRMALGLGLHRSLPTDTKLCPVDREHRKRVWWTLYTLDRLCSSNLGYPLLISDAVIDVELPTNEGLIPAELEEFTDPGHLVANVKLAKITGQIPPPRVFSPTTLALAESCVQAARASNSILSKLFVEGSLASFGYFDAHYLFSSTLILVMSAVMDPNVGMSDAVSYAFTILRAMKEDGNLPSFDYYERLQRTRASVGKMREANEASSRVSTAPNGSTAPQEQMVHDADGSVLGFGDGVPLDNPLIDSFLADKAFIWPDGMNPQDESLRDLACELGDEFLFGPA